MCSAISLSLDCRPVLLLFALGPGRRRPDSGEARLMAETASLGRAVAWCRPGQAAVALKEVWPT
jgi:hypothetical protein